MRLPAQLIRAKRDGEELGEVEIRELMAAITDGSIPDYQVSAPTVKKAITVLKSEGLVLGVPGYGVFVAGG